MTKECVIKNLFGTLVIVIVNVINHVILENTSTIKIVNTEKKIVNKLVEECSEGIDGNKMIYNDTVNEIPLNENVCNSCTIYIVLFIIFLIISINISSAFIYFHWYLKKCNIECILMR